MELREYIAQRINFLNTTPVNQIIGVRTGFDNIDEQIGGFKDGELVVIGGRPGMGKSTFAWQMALEMVQTHKVLVVNLDLSKEIVADKLIAKIAGVAVSDLQNGKFKNTID